MLTPRPNFEVKTACTFHENDNFLTPGNIWIVGEDEWESEPEDIEEGPDPVLVKSAIDFLNYGLVLFQKDWRFRSCSRTSYTMLPLI